ncbi:BatD family protein [Thermomonas sp.]|uniref:BatD family protein n=1 Tax=Thermomonas sp. TaxID=1971895 RepID=UPI00248922AE|nr:BatD family protein [Thermomonas sp.]MDI1251759.1 BatD family protein [Thermomonas sp.]
MSANLRQAWIHACIALMLLACTLPAFAQTRAWLDREQVTYGETATLNIETDSSVQQIDYAPLAANFEIAGQTVRRSFERVNGKSSTHSLFAVGIRPRGPGVVTVPALRVGNSSTEPLRMTIMPASVQKASSDADAFVETEVDADHPYVQQAVGMVVRLFVGVNLLSGQLDQDQPPGTSLQQVGEDLRYQRQIDGRRYSVIERRYLLIPERSGDLLIPGARFNGQSVSDFFDGAFGDGRKPLSAAAPAKLLQVQKIPANAPQPWLPLRDLRLRYVQDPKQARAGVAATVELEMIADGASASQLPALVFPPTKDAQVFADPPQTDVQLVDGRPRATLRLRISIVPLHAGTLSLAGPSVDWWDATQGVARTATLPPLTLQVAPGAATVAADATGASQPTTGIAARQDRKSPVAQAFAGFRQVLPWLAAMLGLAVLLGGWWFARHRKTRVDALAVTPPTTIGAAPKALSLADALKAGGLAGIAEALCNAAGLPGDDLDTLRMQLDDAGQVAAVGRLQAARWGSGDATAALASLRAAFGKGLRLRRKNRQAKALLPPLYPQS